jgi:hypothetical protein
MIRAKQTGDMYVRYSDGIRKWYRAVLENPAFGRIRVSRRKFKRARDAAAYRERVLGRNQRLWGEP